MSYSSDVVADAVRGYWKTCYPRTVIAFFYQKYEYDTEWEWCEELVECNASNDFETVIFQNDFCEGQTCAKDISIVSLDDIVECYTKNHISNHISSMDDLISRQEAIGGLYEMSSDINHLCTLGDYVSFLESLSAQPEIVRCRDCKYQNKGENECESWNLCNYRPWLYIPTDDEHYCGYAERREDET